MGWKIVDKVFISVTKGAVENFDRTKLLSFLDTQGTTLRRQGRCGDFILCDLAEYFREPCEG